MARNVKTLFDLTGRTALITGGSRGLGLQMALEACSVRHPPATPPRAVTIAPPPPVVRRKRADMSDSPHGPVTMAPPPPTYLRPSYAYAGSGSEGFIREYDNMEDAARDLMRECYCQHDSDSE